MSAVGTGAAAAVGVKRKVAMARGRKELLEVPLRLCVLASLRFFVQRTSSWDRR